MYNLADQLAHYGGLREKVDLARWRAAEAQGAATLNDDLDRAHYAFATRAVALMHQTHGDDILVRLLTEVGKTPPRETSMQTVDRAWQTLTGTSLDDLLTRALDLP